MTSDQSNMLNDKIDTLSETLNERMKRVESVVEDIRRWQIAHPQCPAPGSCVGLLARIDRNEVAVIEMIKRVEVVEKHQERMLGAIALLVFIVAPLLTIFGPALRIKFGLP